MDCSSHSNIIGINSGSGGSSSGGGGGGSSSSMKGLSHIYKTVRTPTTCIHKMTTTSYSGQTLSLFNSGDPHNQSRN
jgi:hypothetical protein